MTNSPYGSQGPNFHPQQPFNHQPQNQVPIQHLTPPQPPKKNRSGLKVVVSLLVGLLVLGAILMVIRDQSQQKAVMASETEAPTKKVDTQPTKKAEPQKTEEPTKAPETEEPDPRSGDGYVSADVYKSLFDVAYDCTWEDENMEGYETAWCPEIGIGIVTSVETTLIDEFIASGEGGDEALAGMYYVDGPYVVFVFDNQTYADEFASGFNGGTSEQFGETSPEDSGEEPAQQDGYAAPTETYVWEDGSSVKIDKKAHGTLTASECEYMCETAKAGDSWVILTFEAKNDSGVTIDAMASASISYGPDSTDAEQVYVDGMADNEMWGKILPGKTKKHTVAYAVPEEHQDDVLVTFSMDFEHENAEWYGSIAE